MRVFHTSVSWRSFTGVGITASLLRSPGPFSVFWSILAMLYFRWSPLVFRSQDLPTPLLSLWGSLQARQLLLVSLRASCPITFLILWQGPSTYLSFRYLWFSSCGLLGRQNSLFYRFSFFPLIITRSGILAGIRWSVCMTKSQRILCVSFLGQILACVYTIFSCMVKFRFLAQFLVNPLSHPVVSNLVLFLC